MVKIPARLQKQTEETIRLFLENWKQQDQCVEKELFDGTRFVIEMADGKFRPVVYWGGVRPTDFCENREFDSQNDAKEYAWHCYAGQLLHDAVTRKLFPEATSEI